MKELFTQIESDKDTLRALKDHGDDEEIVRLIDHSFTAKSRKKLEELSELLLAMDFTNLIIKEGVDSSYHLLECTSIDCTEFHNISKTSVLLALLSSKCGVSYDGWGCRIAN